MLHTCKHDDSESWALCAACRHERFLQALRGREFSYEEEEREATAREILYEITKARDAENEAQDLRDLRELTRKIL